MEKTSKQQQQQQQVFAHQMGSHIYAPPAATTATMPSNFAQTIARSNNLHQQIFGHHQHHHQHQQHQYLQQAPRKGSLAMNNANYDQPIIHHQVYHPMTSMTLASRPPRERQPLPLHLTNPAAYQQHQQQQYHQTLPAKARVQAQHQIYQEPAHTNQAHHQQHLMTLLEQQARLNKPLCRCRVMYLGSSVPHITKNGLHGIQEPLRHLYPEEQFSAHKLRAAANTRLTVQRQPVQQQQQQPFVENTIDISHLSASLGIDSWLSVWSNGLLLENVDEFGREIKRFFSIESLHYCAAVRYFDTTSLMKVQQQPSPASGAQDTCPEAGPTLLKTPPDEEAARQQDTNNNSTVEAARPAKKGVVRFLPLDAPIFQCPGMLDASHPPVFGAIMRRTTGIKVLECHAFICRRDAAANALVRCCTHAYADFLSAKRLSVELGCASMAQTGAYAYYAPPQEACAAPKTHRSSSVARRRHNNHGHGQHQAGPFQVVEAIINQAAGHKPAKGSHSSAGPASNETDDNSLADSSQEAPEEENYAIIAKQQQPQSQRPNSRRGRSSRHALRRVKGSSKSLFNDFQPLIRDDHLINYDDQQPVAVDRLSHSLDYLQCCQLQQQQRVSATDNNRQSQEFNDENMVSYSIVKSKRHSRSMQNLDGPFEFSASQATARTSTGGSRGRSRASNRRSNNNNNRYQRGSSVSSSTAAADRLANKKAASFQDMSALRRKGSISSQATVHSNASHRRQELVDHGLNGAIYDTCLVGQDSHEQGQGSAQDYPRILKPDSYLPTSKAAHSVQSGSSAKTAKMGASAKSSSSSSSNNHHRRSHKVSSNHLNDDMIHSMPYPLMEQQQNTLGRHSQLPEATNYYAQPFNVATYGPAPPSNAIYQTGQHHPIYMGQAQPPPPPPPPHPYYMSPTGAYHQQPMYHPANPMYDSTAANYHLAAHLAHPYPAQCHTLNQIAASRAMYDSGMATIATSGRNNNNNKKSSLKSASASLATRFRCLSPPVNFLTSNNNNNSHNKDKKNKRDSHIENSARNSEIYLVDGTSQQQPEVANLSDATIADGPPSIVSGDKQNHLANGRQQQQQHDDSSSSTNDTVATDVVSGQPGFIQQKQYTGQGQQAKAGGKKLSWIKRLSLTMSSNGQHSGDDLSNSGTITSCSSHKVATSLSTDPCGSATASDQHHQQMTNGDQCQPVSEAKQAKQKRKRSSFFGGSLTLGRSSNKPPSSKPSVAPQPT